MVLSHSRRRLAGMALTFLLSVVVLGCDSGPPMGDVEGVVTVDGTPAAAGAITFTPTDGQRAPAGGEIKNGKYAVRVAVGPCKVELRVPKKIGEKKLYGNDPNSPTAPEFEESLPEKYNDNTDLKHDVAAGKTTKNWEAKSRYAK